MRGKSEKIVELLDGQPVIPVLRIDRLTDAVPLARALARGGLPAIEVTLRTDIAIDAIRAIRAEVPEAIVGAGTILSAAHYDAAAEAGAAFIVSPGFTPALLDAARSSPVPFLPGAITPGEMIALMDEGYTLAKFFPAEQAGGIAFLKALASPLAGLGFCPTGGVSAANAPDYLKLPNVACVGGSWVAPDGLMAEGKWDEISLLAQQAARLAA